MHCLYRPNVMMRTGVISRYLILQIWGERFSGGLGERDARTTSFRRRERGKLLRVQMQTKRRRETIEQARRVARLCIALRKIGRSSESEQRKKHPHEQQAKADQRAWINECKASGGAFFHIRTI